MHPEKPDALWIPLRSISPSYFLIHPTELRMIHFNTANPPITVIIDAINIQMSGLFCISSVSDGLIDGDDWTCLCGGYTAIFTYVLEI